ncbi:helix-turn-helix domain-containing protein [Tunicatimonas pelagia]|uniref:helix-turn-helix domain-containing protein n=1 Tax=Tunicatimonas pelagia TaxID=931531 RepID=UPI002665E4F1|nr:AraC family transcriptional regulator [Tunicatimonas pelagia]WKN43680.1 AraC family transcriptional regulator [Tunicatimonas pelagia]
MYSFFDILLFLGISQGLFLVIALQSLQNRNVEANRMLTRCLLIAVLMLFGRIALLRVQELWVWRFAILADTTIFLFGPWLYAYFHRLFLQKTGSPALQVWEYVPALLNALFFLWTLSLSLEHFMQLYQEVTFQYIFLAVEAGGIISLFVYLFRISKLIQTYRRVKDQQISFPQTALPFSIIVVGFLTILGLLWVVSFIAAYGFQTYLPVLNYSTFWVAIPILTYLIGYYSLRQPEIFRVHVPPKTQVKRDRLDPITVQRLKKRLQFYLEEEHVYLQDDLTLKKLADMIDTSPNNLSWLLNQVYQTTFYKYVNRYRVQSFVRRVKNKEHEQKTLLGLAFDSGFSSKSAFNTSFKAETGFTPSQFVNSRSSDGYRNTQL